MKKHLINQRVTKTWNRLSGEVVDASSDYPQPVPVLKMHLDSAPKAMI